MFLVCPRCLAARPEIERDVGFACDDCGHKWDSPHRALSRAYYADLADIQVCLIADDGQRLPIATLPTDIGRDCDFRPLQISLAISRRHCALDFDPVANAFVLKDLGGKGGTAVAGHLLAREEKIAIAPRAEVRLAGVPFVFDARLKTVPSVNGAPAGCFADRAVSFRGLVPLGFIGTSAEGSIEAVRSPDLLDQVLGGLIRSGADGHWKVIVARRNLVRINGEVAIEHNLAPTDHLELAGRLFQFNQSFESLQPESPQDTATIVATDLHVRYGNRSVLGGVSCTIPGGKLTAIAGQSGAGKTTFVKVLSGLRKQDAGTLTVSGLPLVSSNYAAWARRSLALVPQHDTVHGELTVRQCLEFATDLRLGPLVNGQIKRERLERALRDTGLRSMLDDNRISSLSGGERRRINIAVELIAAPDGLLLDEPTSGLDHTTEQMVLAVLKRLARQGKTIAFVTHSTAAIDEADHVIVLRGGEEGAMVLVEGFPAVVKRQLNEAEWGEILDEVSRTNAPAFSRSAPAAALSLVKAMRARLPTPLVLALRYIEIWRSDIKTSVAVLLGLPFLLGILIRLAVIDHPSGGDRLLFGIVATFWLGMNQSVREIVRERAIFIQEQSHRIGCASYLFSKLLFFAVIGVFQAVLLSGPLKWLSVSNEGVSFAIDELRSPWWLIVLMCYGGGILGSCVGLLISSGCLFVREKGEVVATLLVVLVTLPQLLFSEKVLPGLPAEDDEQFYTFMMHTDHAVPECLSFFTVSRYLYMPLDAVYRRPGVFYQTLRFNGAMAAMIGASTIIATWLLLESYVVWSRRRSAK